MHCEIAGGIEAKLGEVPVPFSVKVLYEEADMSFSFIVPFIIRRGSTVLQT